MVRVNDGTLPTNTTIQKTTRPKQNRGRIQNTMEHMEPKLPLVANTHGPIPMPIQYQTPQHGTRNRNELLPNRPTNRLLEQQTQQNTLQLVPKTHTRGDDIMVRGDKHYTILEPGQKTGPTIVGDLKTAKEARDTFHPQGQIYLTWSEKTGPTMELIE